MASSTKVEDGWQLKMDELPLGVASAVGHWLEELGATQIQAGTDSLSLIVPREEPFAGALSWLEQEIRSGRPPFEALGFAAAHISTRTELPGLQVLEDAAGGSDAPAAADDAAAPIAQVTEIEVPTDTERPPSKSRGRFELIGAESAQPAGALEGTEAEEDSGRAKSAEPAPAAPNSRRSRLEPIGYDPEVLQANLEASVAAADSLPDADAQGAFDLFLTAPGPNPKRTAAMLGAALGIAAESAQEHCDATPSLIGTALPAREIRRVDTIVRPATGATFSAEPSSG